MAEVSKTPANVAINAMQAIPFSSMIGGPLNACIEAQAMAARTSWEFIKEVGLNTDEKGQKSAVMVAFSFNRGGRMVQLNVPLLTIRPVSRHHLLLRARQLSTRRPVANWVQRQSSTSDCSRWRQT